MSRVNLTLDDDTLDWLQRHASKAHVGLATFTRDLIREAVAQRELLLARRKLAADYAAGREDTRDLLDELERPQLEGLLDES